MAGVDGRSAETSHMHNYAIQGYNNGLKGKHRRAAHEWFERVASP